MYVKWKLVSVCLEIVLVSVQDRCTVCAERSVAWKLFWIHLMVLLGDVVKWNLIFIRLQIAIISAQHSCMVCTECTMAWKSFWAHPMVLLGDVVQLEARFSLFRDSVNLSAKWVQGLHRMYHGHGNHFEHARWYSLVTSVK
jgi:hypothetical protein